MSSQAVRVARCGPDGSRVGVCLGPARSALLRDPRAIFRDLRAGRAGRAVFEGLFPALFLLFCALLGAFT